MTLISALKYFLTSYYPHKVRIYLGLWLLSLEIASAFRRLHNIPLYDFTIILLNVFPTDGHLVSFQCFFWSKQVYQKCPYLFYKLASHAESFV